MTFHKVDVQSNDEDKGIGELLGTMRAAVEVLREKYPSLNQIAEEVPEETKLHEWRVNSVHCTRLEEHLRVSEERGWEIFSILPKPPPQKECHFAVVLRRPKGETYVE
jgi:hypothetical protein